jgi:hypothetical protein
MAGAETENKGSSGVKVVEIAERKKDGNKKKGKAREKRKD